MLSDNIETVAQRLHLAVQLDALITSEECAALARILDVCVEDARYLEGEVPLAVAPPAVAPNVVRFPGRLRCVTGPDGGAA